MLEVHDMPAMRLYSCIDAQTRIGIVSNGSWIAVCMKAAVVAYQPTAPSIATGGGPVWHTDANNVEPERRLDLPNGNALRKNTDQKLLR